MPPYRSSRCDLNTWTFLRAMIARRTRRMSSSLFPLNITPQMTSIQPVAVPATKPSEITRVSFDHCGQCCVAAGLRSRAADALCTRAAGALCTRAADVLYIRETAAHGALSYAPHRGVRSRDVL